MSVWDHFEEAQGETWKRSCVGTILRLVTTDLTEVGAEVDRLDLVVDKLPDVPWQVIVPARRFQG